MASPKCFVVLSIINAFAPGGVSFNENYGSANYNAIVATNAALQAAYPNNYVDIRTILVQSFNPLLLQDGLDHANDTVPTSLHAIEAAGTITGALASDTTQFTVAGALQGAGYILVSEGEQILVNGASGNTVTDCTRGYNGTTAATHASGAPYSVFDPIHLGASGYKIAADQVAAWLTAPSTITPAIGVSGNPQPVIASSVETASLQAPVSDGVGLRVFGHNDIASLIGTQGDFGIVGSATPGNYTTLGFWDLSQNRDYPSAVIGGAVNCAGGGYGLDFGTSSNYRFGVTQINLRTCGAGNYSFVPLISTSYKLSSGPTWTSGGSSPTGSCANGSLFSRTDTGALYVCQSSAWVAK